MSANADLSAPIRIADGYRLQWEEAQDCHVLLYPEGMIKMNGSAGEIMSRLKDDSTIQSVIDELKSAFPDADLEQDVIKFLEEARDIAATHWISLTTKQNSIRRSGSVFLNRHAS